MWMQSLFLQTHFTMEMGEQPDLGIKINWNVRFPAAKVLFSVSVCMLRPTACELCKVQMTCDFLKKNLSFDPICK